MDTAVWLFDIGRLVFIFAIITQGIVFSAHVANEHRDPHYYASALIALPSLITSWWYFARPPSQRVDRPTLIWLVYSLTVVAFQGLTFGATDVSTHDSTLLYVANVVTPILFLLCVVTGCERCIQDTAFVITSGMTIFNAFDSTDAIFSVSRNSRNIPESFRGGFVAMACILLVWSAFEFTVRTQISGNGFVPKIIVCGLHVIHMTLNAILMGMRIFLYTNGMTEFSTMIAKNAMVFIVRLVYMLSVIGCQPPPLQQPGHPAEPSAPPISNNEMGRFVRPPTPLPARSALRDEKKTNLGPGPDGARLYPSFPRQVHFKDEYQ